LYPYNTNEKPLNGAKKPELIAAMKEMKTQINHYRTTVYPERDSELREADFMPSTTTGSFYTWPRSHYQPTIDALLQGKRELREPKQIPTIPQKELSWGFAKFHNVVSIKKQRFVTCFWVIFYRNYATVKCGSAHF